MLFSQTHRAFRRLISISTVFLLLLCLFPDHFVGTVRAFMPNTWGSWGLAASPNSHTHYSMTQEAIAELSREFFSIGRPGRSVRRTMRRAAQQIADANAEVDALEVMGGTQFNKSASHFDGEAFPESQRRLVNYAEMVVNLLQHGTRTHDEQARWYLGQALHTLQDFYSHSNWIELGNRSPFPDLGRREHSLNIRQEGARTCTDCERNDCSDCGDTLTAQVLTTGYYGGDDRPKPTPFKCSHGGRFDSSARGAYGNGLCTGQKLNNSSKRNLLSEALKVA